MIDLACPIHNAFPAGKCPECSTIEVKETNPKDEAASDRVDLSLIPDTALVAMALAFHEGHQKYGAYNWRVAGVRSHIYISACRRHVNKWWNGLDVDPSSHVKELGHAMACLAIIIDAMECGKLVDDRPPAVDLSALHESAREVVRHLQKKFGNGPGRYTQLKHGQEKK